MAPRLARKGGVGDWCGGGWALLVRGAVVCRAWAWACGSEGMACAFSSSVFCVRLPSKGSLCQSEKMN